jgi:AraC family transcriptional regulator
VAQCVAKCTSGISVVMTHSTLTLVRIVAGIKMEKRKRTKLAYIEHTGKYSEIPFQRYFEKLYGWARENHVRPGVYPLGIYQDRPDDIPASELRSEIAIPVYGTAKPDADIKIKDIPAMKVAAISHKGPSTEYTNTYRKLNEWIAEKGYEWSGPAIEVYTRKPKIAGGETILFAKIEAPIRRK